MLDDKDIESEFSHGDFGRDVAQIIKLQIELLLNYIVKSVKNKEERRNRYLFPLKYLLCYAENSGLHDILKMEAAQEEEFVSLLRKQIEESNVNAANFIAFCRKTIFLETKAIDWETNVWYVEKLNIPPKRYSLSGTIESFSFLDIGLEDNRKMLQEYMKYLFTVTNLNVGTIRIKQAYIKEFLKYLEKQEKAYFNKLSIQRISPQSYNNKIQAVTIFLQYLQMKDYINYFTIPVFFYKNKSYPKDCEVRDLDKKLDLLMLHLSEFPEQLRIMSLLLLYTRINKGKMFLLRNADFYYENENS